MSKRLRSTRLPNTSAGHRWVGAALLPLGRGDNTPRAEHAARTGRSTLPAGTRVEVLEVYCADCRVPYTASYSYPCPKRVVTRAG